MKVKFANTTLESPVYIVIKHGMIWDVRQDATDYRDDGCDIFPLDCRGEVELELSDTWELKVESSLEEV